MANEDAAREPIAGPIGRVRLDDTPGDVAVPIGAASDTEESGWSVAGVGLALLLAAIMVGALIIILWATFQARA